MESQLFKEPRDGLLGLVVMSVYNEDLSSARDDLFRLRAALFRNSWLSWSRLILIFGNDSINMTELHGERIIIIVENTKLFKSIRLVLSKCFGEKTSYAFYPSANLPVFREVGCFLRVGFQLRSLPFIHAFSSPVGDNFKSLAV